MGLSNSPSNAMQPLILDASVAINLGASGFAIEIIQALPSRTVVTPSVIAELESGRDPGRHHGPLLSDLVTAGIVDSAELGEAGLSVFAQLVTGSTAATLDDGEAETIAYAIEIGAIAVVDEKKANRICAERFPELKLASTTELFMAPHVVAALKREYLAQAVLNALRSAHMQVPQNHLPWVIELIGEDEARTCLSLPQRTRK